MGITVGANKTQYPRNVPAPPPNIVPAPSPHIVPTTPAMYLHYFWAVRVHCTVGLGRGSSLIFFSFLFFFGLIRPWFTPGLPAFVCAPTLPLTKNKVMVNPYLQPLTN